MKYETILKEKKSSRKEVFIISIQADSNDADYMNEKTIIKKDNMTDEVIDLIEKFRKIEGVGHALRLVYEDEDNEYGIKNDDLFNYINIPFTDWGICHTLEDLVVEYVDENGKIFDVDFYETYEDEDEESEED